MLEKIWALCAKIAEVTLSHEEMDEYLEFVEESLLHLVDYANCVIRQQSVFPSWRFRYEGEDLLLRMEESMYERNRIHGAAVASMRALNRHCLLNEIPEMFVGIPDGPDDDENVKDAVAKAIGVFINEAYNKGIGNDPMWHAFDAAVEGRTEEYDEKVVSALVRHE